VDPVSRLASLARVPRAPASPHESRATAFLRPAVFGGSDGLVSNLSLVMGVAGAQADNRAIVIAGIAGLLAGAFSMAVGEYISVRSQHELFDAQLQLQARQLREDPAGERAILERIYCDRGFGPAEAADIVETLFATDERALAAMMRDEVGLDPRNIGGPWAAAASSFAAFFVGALIPLIPFLLLTGTAALVSGVAISLAALFTLGVGVSLLTRRSALRSGLRQLALGGIAALVTYLVGQAIGASVA
jgi:VIT1/CCC1 family predicted Fe2+/Mn2+ transporter